MSEPHRSDQAHHLTMLLRFLDRVSPNAMLWLVQDKYGMFHADHPSEPSPPPCFTQCEAERVWREWFRCMRG